MNKKFMSVLASGHPNWASVACAGVADTIARLDAMPKLGRFFDQSVASFDFDGPVVNLNIDAIPPEDRPTLVPLLIEFAVTQAEKRRRNVRFLPAQVIRRAMASLRITGAHPI